MKSTFLATLALTSLLQNSFASENTAEQIRRSTTSSPLVSQILDRTNLQDVRQTEVRQSELRDLTQTRVGGSGIGGGVVIEHLVSWCDDASNILNDAITDAREVWGLNGDSVQALSLYKDGLTLSLRQVPRMPTNGQLYTLRYVKRGVVLAQIMGLDDILAGRTLPQKHTEGLVNFFDHYLSFTRDVSERIDRSLYIPYAYGQNARPYSIRELEVRTVDLSISAISELDRRFVFITRDQSNMYSTMSIPMYLKAQSYLLNQVAKDLRETLFSDSFTCQANRMEQLSENIQRYLSNRSNSSQDAIRLNRFTLTLRDIISKLTSRNCF
jgi:hypothetical protein